MRAKRIRSVLCGFQRTITIDHRHAGAIQRMRHAEPLQLHLAAEAGKWAVKSFCCAHAGRAAGAPPNRANCLRYSIARAPLKGICSRRRFRNGVFSPPSEVGLNMVSSRHATAAAPHTASTPQKKSLWPETPWAG